MPLNGSTPIDLLSKQWRIREALRLEVARLRASEGSSLPLALERALSLGAAGLKTERSSIWLFDEAAQTLRCALQLDQGRVTVNPSDVRIREVQTYARALQDSRVLAISDVSQEPLTRERYPFYFEPAGIRASLDAALYRGGRMTGVLCHEHKASVRTWTAADRDFACSLAALVALGYASHERLEAEAALADAEAQLAETRSADALTRLARKVAHDLNNVLSVIMLSVETLERKAAEPAAVSQAASAIAEAAESGALLARQLVALGGERSRGAPARRAEVDLTLRQMEPRLRDLVGGQRTLHLAPGAGESAVQLFPAQLEQLILALVDNAREATGPSGNIKVSSRLNTWKRSGRETDIVAIEVRDDGCGLDDATRARICTPFFSTRTAAGHKGLGLATVLALVQDLRGALQVESAPGEGALFRVALPRLE